MPYYIAAALLALGLVLPVAVAYLAAMWEKEGSGAPILGKIVMMVLFVGSIGYFAGIAAYGHSRFAEGPYSDYYFYWIAGVIAIAHGIHVLDDLYGKD